VYSTILSQILPKTAQVIIARIGRPGRVTGGSRIDVEEVAELFVEVVSDRDAAVVAEAVGRTFRVWDAGEEARVADWANKVGRTDLATCGGVAEDGECGRAA